MKSTTHTKLKPSLVASYDIRPGNGVGTILERDGQKKKTSKANKKRKKEESKKEQKMRN